jgi:hypothetical protein
MTVERQVRGVEGQVMPHQRPDSPPVATGDGLEPAPEQPMVYEQEIRAAVRGTVDRGLAGVDRNRQSIDPTRVLDLESIQCARIVRNVVEAEVLTEVAGQFVERRHGLLWVENWRHDHDINRTATPHQTLAAAIRKHESLQWVTLVGLKYLVSLCAACARLKTGFVRGSPVSPGGHSS